MAGSSPMRHTRHYTLEQARASMAWVAERVAAIRQAGAQLEQLGADARAAVAALDDRAGGAYPGREPARALVGLSRALAELQAVEIVLRDVGRGLVDFPAIRPDGSGAAHDCGGAECPLRGQPDGEEIYLCWLVDDEEEIGFWHAPDAGFAGRRAL